MRITHVAGATPIVPDGGVGAAFCREALGLALQEPADLRIGIAHTPWQHEPS